MQGKVKWFSEENGYGYIVGDDGNDYRCWLDCLSGRQHCAKSRQLRRYVFLLTAICVDRLAGEI